jgi:predicted nucleic acid-binding protein
MMCSIKYVTEGWFLSAVRLDFIVSGDGDLLALDRFQGIAIVTPAEALGLILASET